MFEFIDLFSGVGGFHMAAKKLGGSCVLACDIDPEARAIYKLNYGIEPHHDINKLLPSSLPAADFLFAGFPCQAFSSIGDRGGTSVAKGRLFYRMVKLIKHANKRPDTLIFENVKGLVYMDNGKVLMKFVNMIKKLGYNVAYRVLDAAQFKCPQHRERVYIVASLNSPVAHIEHIFDKIDKPVSRFTPFSSVFDKSLTPDTANRITRFDGHIKEGYVKPTKTGAILRAKLNNFIDKKLYSSDGTVGTLCATYTPAIYDERFEMARHMTIKEMKSCQGFSALKTGDFQARTVGRFMGNAVNVNVVYALLKATMQK